MFVSNEQKSSLWHKEEGRSSRKADDLPCRDWKLSLERHVADYVIWNSVPSQSAILAQVPQGFPGTGFANLLPVRGRKRAPYCCCIGGCWLFANLLPVRGRKLKDNECAGVFAVSEEFANLLPVRGRKQS